jgi:flagellar basal-body rod protein FlgC
MSNAIGAALSALGAFGKKINVTAHNIANMNTEGFKKSRAILQDADPSGVTVSISQVDTPGFPIPATDGTTEMKESSNVDLGEEIINLQITKHAFIANFKTIEAEEAMVGAIFDIFA